MCRLRTTLYILLFFTYCIANAAEQYGYCMVTFPYKTDVAEILDQDSKDAEICKPVVLENGGKHHSAIECPISWHFKQYEGYHTVSTSLGDLLNSNALPQNTSIVVEKDRIKSLTNVSHKVYYGVKKTNRLCIQFISRSACQNCHWQLENFIKE
jgi:hypothetical protein